MANTWVFGPYYTHIPSGLAPRKAYNMRWLPSTNHESATIKVDGHPSPARRNVDYALWVSDSSIITRDIGSGDISNIQTSFSATFFNSANVGETTIYDFAAFVTVCKQ